MLHHITKLIAEGEHQQLDFKFEIADAHKIARTLVAFANTTGGKVFIGVSDTGAITGVSINPESVQNWINEIKNKTTPSIIPEIEVINIEEKEIVSVHKKLRSNFQTNCALLRQFAPKPIVF